MIEFRKEYFADERDDNLNEIGKPTQRQDALGHVTGRSPGRLPRSLMSTTPPVTRLARSKTRSKNVNRLRSASESPSQGGSGRSESSLGRGWWCCL